MSKRAMNAREESRRLLQDLEDAWHLWEKSLGGREVEGWLLKKTALPIYRLADPRLEYRREELKNFARVDADDIHRALGCEHSGGLVVPGFLFSFHNPVGLSAIVCHGQEVHNDHTPMTITIDTNGTCCKQFKCDITDGQFIHNITFKGGCKGNLQALSRLLEGQSVDYARSMLADITCGIKPTSCMQEFVKGLDKAIKEGNNKE